MTISIQGQQGSFHHIVAEHQFGTDIVLLERDSFPEVFADVREGLADAGIVAIENSIIGPVASAKNYDLLRSKDLFIVGETFLKIGQQLIGLPDAEISDITEVHSQKEALDQCLDYFRKYPHWQLVPEKDTAGSVALVKTRGKKSMAAVASRRAASLHGMKILAPNIETNANNYTRFLTINKQPDYPADANKTSLVFQTANQPGSLVKALHVFSEAGINLSKIESRPILGQRWEYYFYADIEAGIGEVRVQESLEELKKFTQMCKVLGSYIQGEYVD